MPTFQKADILLSTTDAKVSGAIRFGTGSDYSHAAVYVGSGGMIEAVGNGVRFVTLDVGTADNSITHVYRRRNLTPQQADLVCQYARQQVGKDYDSKGAIGAGASTRRGIIIGSAISPAGTVAARQWAAENRRAPEVAFYCSELVAHAFRAAGAPLVMDAATVTPEQVRLSNYIELIGQYSPPGS